MKYQTAVLDWGKERPIQNRHHWIFSRAFRSLPEFTDGDIMQIASAEGEILGHAYMNNTTVITGRMLNFDESDPIEALKENIKKAIHFRSQLFDETQTDTYRLINGEGDYIPGLIVDKYGPVLVIQIATVGMDKLKQLVIDSLIESFGKGKITCVYEKSTMSARLKDGLKPTEGVVWGEIPEELIVKENGIKFGVDLRKSQKTGLFIDMRDMRSLVGSMSKNKRVLNCFSYTGGFSLYAMKGGAKGVDSVDIAEDAIVSAENNYDINGIDKKGSKFIAQDAFVFLREDELNYDFIILDPPAFAKKKDDIERAKRGYGEINRTTLSKMPENSFLLTCSCSYHVNQELFELIVARAARDAGRNVKIIHKQRLAMDHPINIHHSEIDYLKSLLLYVE
jgi:23S rRNA (cytosine1962-C5)-methyltransferase